MAEGLRMGVIGLGNMGRIHLRNLLERVPGVRVEAVADPAVEELVQRGLLRLPPTVRRFRDFEEVLALDLDAYVIASATASHERVLWAAMETGRPLFCEKPLAATLEASRALHAALKARGVPLQLGFMRRFDPLYVRAKALIEEGRIGEPYHFSSVSRDQFAPPVEVARHSGGFCVDTGVHDFDVARWLLGDEIASVYARGGLFVSKELAAIGDIDQMHISFATLRGRLGLIELSRNAIYGYDIRTEILGSRGAIQVVTGNKTTTALLVENQVVGDTYRNYAERFDAAYRNEMAAFVEAVREGRPLAVGSEDGVRAMAAAVAAQRALETGTPQAVALE